MPPSTAPAGMAAKSRAKASPPSLGPAKFSSANCGKRARGMPKTIAMMSTTKLIINTG